MERKIVSIEIPKDQKDIIKRALFHFKKSIDEGNEIYSENDSFNLSLEESHSVLFDIFTLKALLNYEVTVSVNEEIKKSFSFVEGVDFPEYTTGKIDREMIHEALQDVYEDYTVIYSESRRYSETSRSKFICRDKIKREFKTLFFGNEKRIYWSF